MRYNGQEAVRDEAVNKGVAQRDVREGGSDFIPCTKYEVPYLPYFCITCFSVIQHLHQTYSLVIWSKQLLSSAFVRLR